MPVARLQTAQSNAAGGVVIRTTPGQPESVDIVFLDGHGADLSQADQRKLERIFSREEFRRAFPGEIGDLPFPPRVMEAYTLELLRQIDIVGPAGAGLKVVVDTGGGTASLVLPTLLGRLGVDVLTVNNGLDETSPTESARRAASRRWPGSAAGRVVQGRVRCALRPGGGADLAGRRARRGSSTTSGRCSSCSTWSPPSARGGTVALPVTTTRVAEQVAAFHGVDIRWIATTPAAVDLAPVGEPDVVFGGDGRGGFVVPKFSTTYDGIAAFVRLVGLVARTQLQLSEIDARIPRSHVEPARGADAVGGEGDGHARGRRGGRRPLPLDTTDGVRVVERGRQLGAGAARPGRAADPPLGRGRRRRRVRRAARALGARSCRSSDDG